MHILLAERYQIWPQNVWLKKIMELSVTSLNTIQWRPVRKTVKHTPAEQILQCTYPGESVSLLGTDKKVFTLTVENKVRQIMKPRNGPIWWLKGFGIQVQILVQFCCYLELRIFMSYWITNRLVHVQRLRVHIRLAYNIIVEGKGRRTPCTTFTFSANFYSPPVHSKKGDQ